MGATISRLLSRRKDLTTYSAQLKSLDENIRLLEAERVGRYSAHRRIARGLILYSSAVAIVLFAVSVLTLEHSTTALIIVAYGLVVFAIKWAVDVFFAYTIESAAIQLAAMESNKVAMIDELMELTDFKQTAQLIQTYSKRTPPQPPSSSSSSSPSKGPPPPLLRAATMLPSSLSASKAPLPQRPQPLPPSAPSPPAVTASAVRVVGGADDVSHPSPRRSAVDKVIDFILNDGVNNRFALICKYCYTHNGLVREDELGKRFRCAQCNWINGPPLPPDWKPPTAAQQTPIALTAATPPTTPPITPSATAKHNAHDSDIDQNIFFRVEHKTQTPLLSPSPSPSPPPPPPPPPAVAAAAAAVALDTSVVGSSVSHIASAATDVVASDESSGASSSDGVRRRRDRPSSSS